MYFTGRWIIFYHTGGNEFGGTITTGTKRVTGIEYLAVDSTGSSWTFSPTAKTYRGVGAAFSYDTIQIDRYSPKGISGAQVAVVNGDEPPGWMVTKIANNGYIRYDGVDFSQTDTSSGEIQVRVASVSTGGIIDVREGGATGTLLGSVTVPSTGGITRWTTITAPMSDAALELTGTKNIVLVFKTTAANQFNVNWIRLGKMGAGNSATSIGMSFPAEQPSGDYAMPCGVRYNGDIPAALYNLKGQRIILSDGQLTRSPGIRVPGTNLADAKKPLLMP